MDILVVCRTDFMIKKKFVGLCAQLLAFGAFDVDAFAHGTFEVDAFFFFFVLLLGFC